MYSYDMATINSVLPAFANAKDVIICDEVASPWSLDAVQCCTDSSGPLACTGPCTQASCLAWCSTVGAGNLCTNACLLRAFSACTSAGLQMRCLRQSQDGA